MSRIIDMNIRKNSALKQGATAAGLFVLVSWCFFGLLGHLLMKVILYTPVPFMLTHGGAQIQMEQTQSALEKLDVVVEPLRWWDDKQRGDILHYLGRVPVFLLGLAQRTGMKVVQADMLTGASARSDGRLWLEKVLRRLFVPLIPTVVRNHFNWDSYQMADACVALTPREAQVMKDSFRAPAERVHVVPNGVEQDFFQAPKAERGPWLVCTATITERKRVVELAEAAVLAQTPLWVVGKPYSETDGYHRRFQELVSRHPRLLRFEGPVQDRAELAKIYRAARGFVLLSTKESLSLSTLEAAACECPVLLSDLPWATSYFGAQASYCPIASAAGTAKALKSFYEKAPTLSPPSKPLSWLDVGQQLKGIYESLLRR